MSTVESPPGLPATPEEPDGERSVIAAVRQAALELLESLPGRPERLRVSAADVTVDLDWRTTPAAAPPPIAAAPAAPDAVAEPQAAESRPNVHQVCAPSVGTFYHAPAPDAEPFVAVGDTVIAGQQIGIVEVMKLMLPVEADRAGRVVEMLIADGRPVEYGEPLVALEPPGDGE